MEWNTYKLPIIGDESANEVLARQVTFDFAMETKEFRTLFPKLHSGITLIQLNQLPKYYLDLAKIKSKTRYDLLHRECDYLFEIDIPSAADYGTLRSSNKNWLEDLLKNKDIDWKNLP